MTTDVLVTGAASGLGAYLHAALGGRGHRRGDALSGAARTIVHCAANARRAASPGQRAAQRADNVDLTGSLVGSPHERFVFFSSIAVYDPASDYGRDKREAEALVAERAKRPLVLRCGTLLGPGMRPNSLTRLIAGEPLTLAADSRFAWVLYGQVLEFLRAGLDLGLEGTYDLVPGAPATLGEAARALGLSPAWGEHLYLSPPADGAKARAVCPGFGRTALENALAFAKGAPS